jgi:hypothetical protein
VEDQIKQIRELRLAKELGLELHVDGSLKTMQFQPSQDGWMNIEKLWDALLAAEAKLEAERWREIAKGEVAEEDHSYLICYDGDDVEEAYFRGGDRWELVRTNPCDELVFISGRHQRCDPSGEGKMLQGSVRVVARQRYR